ncbi:MAG: hypothetical protein DRQ88_07105 [Epsilonproteobacteria bacterium]|nr:MAG: hypothetical protein DRQ89_08710 [Campylobacterota bacterium]RLA66323.1 MAG: hypothetical protein DRQ88_07105 [Campylobacterota bacterium]
MKFFLLASFLLCSVAWGQFNIGNVPFHKINKSDVSPEKIKLLKKLWKTRALNNLQIYRELNLESKKRHALFSTYNPFRPSYVESYESLDNLRYPLPTNPLSFILREKIQRVKYYSQEVVVAWESNPHKNSYVCGIKFTNSLKIFYRLKTFPSKKTAESKGYVVTHYGKCGMCSSLKDLAVYLAKPDLTTPARKCSKKLGIRSIKSCYKHKLGFSNYCSEQWAYNSENTRKKCGGTCIKYYGFLNVLRNRMDRPNTDEDGNLNACLACDEFKSGPGFKYGAGRTRRNSGITSAIERGNSEIFDVDHFRYFED